MLIHLTYYQETPVLLTPHPLQGVPEPYSLMVGVLEESVTELPVAQQLQKEVGMFLLGVKYIY